MMTRQKQQLSNETMITVTYSYLKSPHISKIWIFLKFGVCETLRKIYIIFAKLKFKSFQNLDCAKYFANSRFPKSGVCEIFHKVQLDLFCKATVLMYSRCGVCKIFRKFQILHILHFGHFAKSS